MLTLIFALLAQDPMARVTLQDGSTLMCKIKIDKVTIDGKDIPIHKVREIALSKDGDELVTTDGVLKGKIKWDEVKATSDVGMLTLWRDQVTKIEIYLPKTPDGKHPEPKAADDEPADMGIQDPDHESNCYLGGGRLILDFERNFRTESRRTGYFFDLKPANEGLAQGFSTCRQCLGSAWTFDHYDRYGPVDEGDPCPHCDGKGSIGIWKNSMRLCLHCGRSH